MQFFMNDFCHYVLLFFIFSFLGWCMEVVLKYFQYHRFINRGFLIGPYCPIYGTGVVFVTFVVGLLTQFEDSYGVTFVVSMVLCGVLEYAVSYCLEKRFHARWWDYSQKPMNLHGRVWIGNLILFGLGGTVIVKIIAPEMFAIFSRLSDYALYILSSCILLLMISDYGISHVVMKFVKTSVENSEADDTETISKEIRALLSDKSVLYRRLAGAYPDVIYRTERIKNKMQEVKKEMERIREEAGNHVEEMQEKLQEQLQEQKQAIAATLETTTAIRDDIIEKQDALIDLLEAGASDAASVEAAHAEIDVRKEQLEKKRKLFYLS